MTTPYTLNGDVLDGACLVRHDQETEQLFIWKGAGAVCVYTPGRLHVADTIPVKASSRGAGCTATDAQTAINRYLSDK